jgi:hypothetical protein
MAQQLREAIMRRHAKWKAMAGVAMVAVVAMITMSTSIVAPASAQQVNQGRDCQTVRTCNFSRSGDVRGCLSSYSCRVCRVVATRCALPGGGSRCEQLRCNWG